MDEDELKKKLTPEQYNVMRQGGTEAPFSNDLYLSDETGEYNCAVCGAMLFSSDSKYVTNVPGLKGWPSFSELKDNDALELKNDYSFGMSRVEVSCKNCGSHLGHVFNDPESPSGKHYCINSVCLDFKKR